MLSSVPCTSDGDIYATAFRLTLSLTFSNGKVTGFNSLRDHFSQFESQIKVTERISFEYFHGMVIAPRGSDLK